ncbi:helix-turn-helix domain-containing protein [Portibacter marinus]|uniref:helix-turn-helix domain-containing protein n=1 Tax=Portibacter marinus TaxID=2898660 RepID=UPI00387344D1
MKMKNKNIKTLSDIKDEHFGKIGTPTRDQLEEEYDDFKIGFLLQEARLKKGLTQQQLADKVGTSKSYISKIENNVKEARLSTLKKIVELGFGGNVELSINL